MSILVTGATGFLGRNLIPKLIEQQHEIIAVVRPQSKVGILPNGIEILKEELINISESDLWGVDTVIHLAGQSKVSVGQSHPEDTYLANVTATENLLNAAEAANVRKFIFASTCEVYGPTQYLPVNESHPCQPGNHYGKTKLTAEGLVQDSTISTASLRFTNVVGAGDSGRLIPLWRDALQSGLPLKIFNDEDIVDFLSIHDAVAVILAAMEDPNVIPPTNVGSGVGVALIELAEALKQAFHASYTVLQTTKPKQFVADISQLQSLLGILPQDPYDFLLPLFA